MVIHEWSRGSWDPSMCAQMPHVHMDARFKSIETEVETSFEPEYESTAVGMHDGGRVTLNTVDQSCDPADSIKAYTFIREKQADGSVITGLLYIDEDADELHRMPGTVKEPLNAVDRRHPIPGKAVLRMRYSICTPEVSLLINSIEPL